MAAAMQPNIHSFFNNPSGALGPAAHADFSGHAFKVFKVEYHKSATAANAELVQQAGGLENVLQEMWQMLPEHKRKAYEDYARKVGKDALAPTDPEAAAKRLEQEKARAAKEAQREADRQLIWQRRDEERRRKEQQKQEQERKNLFKDHLQARKGKVEDLQLLVENITNDEAGRKALGLRETVSVVPPEASPERGMPPAAYSEAIFVTNALERFRELTGLPPLSLQEIISVLRNRPCEQLEGDEDDNDEDRDEKMQEHDDNDDEHKEVVLMRNAIHEKLMLILAESNAANSGAQRERMLGVDLSAGTDGIIDAHSWPEVARRYIDFVANDPEKRKYGTMDDIRRVGDRMSQCSYKSLSTEERTAILSFLCAEILDTAKEAIDKSFDKLAELKRQRRVEQAEESRLEKQKEVEEKARIAEQKLKNVEEQKQAFGPWLAARNEDPETVPGLHPQLWKAFDKEYQAEKAAREAADAAKDSDTESDDEGPAHTGIADDTAIVIENEESLTRGEYLRQLRAKREEMRKAREEKQRAKEQRRARRQAKADAAKAEKEKKRAAEARAREKQQRYDEQLRALAPRLSPLGTDRFFNRYWYFSCLPDKIFVEQAQLPASMLPPQVKKFRECDGTPAERRQAAIDDTVQGLHEIRAETLQTVLTAMKVDAWKTLPDPTSKPELVELIMQHAQTALCSESYLSMLVCTYRADKSSNEHLQCSTSESDEDDGEQLAHRDKRAKLASPMSRTWEYYDTKEQVDELLAYLTDNGEREAALKQELNKIYDKVVAAMETSAGFSGVRRSYGRRRFSRPKPVMRSAASVLMDLLTTFVATAKTNRAEVDDVKASVHQATCWQDYIQPSLAVSELLRDITQRVTKEEKEGRRYAENSGHGMRWNEWLQEWDSFTSNVQTEAALLFSLYSLRQRAHSTLPVAKRNARSRSESPVGKAMSEEEDIEEVDDGPVDWGSELREAAVSGKLMEMKRLLARLSEEDSHAADDADEDGKTALMVEVLLEHGVDCEKRDQDGWTALLFAATDGAKHSAGCLELLLKHGAKTDAVDNEFDMTAWLWACDHGRSACLQPLIDAGCDTQATDKDGKTGREIAQSNNPPHESVLAFIDSVVVGERKEQ